MAAKVLVQSRSWSMEIPAHQVPTIINMIVPSKYMNSLTMTALTPEMVTKDEAAVDRTLRALLKTNHPFNS